MKNNEFKTVEQVWEAIDKGTKIYWGNTSYQVIAEADNCPELKMFGNRGNQCLAVRCMSNWFGSKLHESELPSLFTKGDNK